MNASYSQDVYYKLTSCLCSANQAYEDDDEDTE